MRQGKYGFVIRALFCGTFITGFGTAQRSLLYAQKAATSHQNHSSQHGGILFMAMDGQHHLEGILEPSGIFRVYLYDSYTQPLVKELLKQAGGIVRIGESDSELKLALSEDGNSFQVALPDATRFPLTLTLLMRLPGMDKDAKPELFTFPFSAYSTLHVRSAV
jgi:hypothetical protein